VLGTALSGPETEYLAGVWLLADVYTSR
jgi:hypothetical protein